MKDTITDYTEYDSPLNIVYQHIGKECAKKIDDMIYTALCSVSIEVDKEKLLEILKQDSKRYREAYRRGYATAESNMYSATQVAEIMADLFGDSCACNFNGIDEWLPEHCEFSDTHCPDPGGVSCWEQYLKFRDKAKAKGECGNRRESIVKKGEQNED
jgi:hypothetical protein